MGTFEFCLFLNNRCSVNQQTIIVENGVSQKARFNFPAFRFIEQQNETVSTYYLHCITRLCEPSTCSTFKAWDDTDTINSTALNLFPSEMATLDGWTAFLQSNSQSRLVSDLDCSSRRSSMNHVLCQLFLCVCACSNATGGGEVWRPLSTTVSLSKLSLPCQSRPGLRAVSPLCLFSSSQNIPVQHLQVILTLESFAIPNSNITLK